MLVLSRQRNEKIVIGRDISVAIVEIRGDKVRLGIEAPSDVPVHRQEVFDAIQRQGWSVSREQADLEQAVEATTRENPGAFNEVRERMADGEPLHAIEEDLDRRENDEKR